MKTEINPLENKETRCQNGAVKERVIKKWFVVITNSRAEQKVAQQIQELGIEAYCPTRVRIKQWSDRKKKITESLIPSIVFVKIEEDKRNLVFQSRGVARYLYWLERPAVVRDLEIETMREWLKKDYLDPKIEHLKPGDRVSIPNGPFKGQQAVLREASNNSMQLLLVEVGIKITITRPKE